MRWRVLGKLKSKQAQERKKEIIKILLKNRGLLTSLVQKQFLQPVDPEKLTPKQVGVSPLELRKAVKRIKLAIENKEKIIVYGDYDTDGVCATAIVWEAIFHLKGQVMPFIPKREEGYGLEVDRLKKLAQDGVKLIITVDQGIVAYQQAKKAKSLGIDLIITDHHVLGKKKPVAWATIHTTNLSGAGVAWLLAQSLGDQKGLDLATIGTISDMVPLLGVNRSLVKAGLTKLKKTKRPGLLALFRLAGISPEKIGTYEVGFIIGPRLNASGRMDDPLEALRLVCTGDKKRAFQLAREIDHRNRARQELTSQTSNHARKRWIAQDGKSALIFVSHQSYQEGIVGLVASRLKDQFYRPAVVVAQGKQWSKASARSIEEFNIIQAIRASADLLGPHGGHPKAAGFSIETVKLERFKKRLIKLAEEKLDQEKLVPNLQIDLEVDLKDLSLSLYQELEKLSPFGESNPEPVFASRGVRVVEARLIGADKRHLRLQLTDLQTGTSFAAIGFGLADFFTQLSHGQSIDIAYNLLLDTWNNNKRLQLKLKDLKV